eukprot:scaffold368_cov258-Pinguiococcus_pyrenoidosus.AAC.43
MIRLGIVEADPGVRGEGQCPVVPSAVLHHVVDMNDWRIAEYDDFLEALDALAHLRGGAEEANEALLLRLLS